MLRVGAKRRAGNDSRDFSGHVLTFSATVFAIMMPWRDQCGTDGRHRGRSSDAVEVDRGVETGIEGAGGSKVAAANIAFIFPTSTEQAPQGKKRIVAVIVKRDEEIVMSGTFACFVPAEHVLAASAGAP
ncbi:MAG: hypothetical protein MUC50_10420 [Myxococcota bacterium]|nr:hypothetical protein [Myxococcota bacterium]